MPIQTWCVMTTTPNPHTGVPVRQSSTISPRAVCSRVILQAEDVPDGSLVEVTSMLQVGHEYPPMIMIGGYLQAAPSGAAWPNPPVDNFISRPHGTNFNLAVHHQPTYHHGCFWVTADNRSKWFSETGFCVVQQVAYAASTAAPVSGWVLDVEYVQLDVKVTAPDPVPEPPEPCPCSCVQPLDPPCC